MGARDRQTFTEWEDGIGRAYDRRVRPATAIVILILLVIIAIAGIIQLWLIFSPPG
jgi:hypothetical protein